MQCGVCGGTEFAERAILWDKLVSEWQLSVEEVAYINRQQGCSCTGCGANLRSIALANALRASFGTEALLRDAVVLPATTELALLELNDAGSLTPVLRRMARYTHGAYPEVDMHRLPYGDATFDVVVHSDTLEHVSNPVHALAECRRVLRPKGTLCFTVPTIIGRLSRSREGLPVSLHGNPSESAADWAVRTEFGADMWTYVLSAGFSEVAIHAVAFPAGLALSARSARR